MLNIHSPRQITFSLYFLLCWIHFRFACGATKFKTILSSDARYQTSCHVKYTFPTSNYISYFLLCWIHFRFAFFGSATKFKTILSSVTRYQMSCHVKYVFLTPNYISYFLLWIHFWFAFFGSATKFKIILSSVTRYQIMPCKIMYSSQITFRTSCYAGFTSGLHFSAVPPSLKSILSSVTRYQTSCHVKYVFLTPNYISYFLLRWIHFPVQVCVFRQCHQV